MCSRQALKMEKRKKICRIKQNLLLFQQKHHKIYFYYPDHLVSIYAPEGITAIVLNLNMDLDE